MSGYRRDTPRVPCARKIVIAEIQAGVRSLRRQLRLIYLNLSKDSQQPYGLSAIT